MDDFNFLNGIQNMQKAALSIDQIQNINRNFANAKLDACAQDAINAKARRDGAIMDTAENTKQINEKVESIDKSLIRESEERKQADIKNDDESKKRFRINFWLTVLSIAIAVVSMIVAIAKP